MVEVDETAAPALSLEAAVNYWQPRFAPVPPLAITPRCAHATTRAARTLPVLKLRFRLQ
jgi:hypothetical protein